MTITTLNSTTSSVPFKAHGTPNYIGKVLKDFLRKVEYRPLGIPSVNKELEDALNTEMDARNIRCPQLEKTLHLAASSSDLPFYKHTFPEKLGTALFNWFLIYVDDMSSRDVGPFAAFEQNFLRGLPQLDPVLGAYADILLNMYDRFDTVTANYIISSTIEFINSNCVQPEIETLPLVRGAVRFPEFIRDRSGVGVATALQLFPKTKIVGVKDYIQALPDMNFWIDAVNDLFSFYKEALAGETGNYIDVRAYVEGKTELDILSHLGKELDASHRTITAALAHSPRATDIWLTFERGYIEWHLAEPRYKLKDLGL